MEIHKLQINTTATFLTQGNPKTAKNIIFALHGYGQLSQFFIKKFESLSKDYFLVIPEGLHRFYLQGTGGRVGASWMTKEKREDDIKDYIKYLDSVWSLFSENRNIESKILLGFSQGGATASRWQQFGNFNANKFILWAGVFPPDMPQNWETNFKKCKNYFIVGNNDPYYNSDRIEQQSQYFTKNDVNFTTKVFSGKHEIETKMLLEICS
ncbi:MAG: alpha/beta hydrolase [Crocinitomicaceae bacterium]